MTAMNKYNYITYKSFDSKKDYSAFCVLIRTNTVMIAKVREVCENSTSIPDNALF